jgi:hypothetical protein
LATDRVQAQGPRQPQGPAADEAAHVLAPDHRDVLAELPPEQVDQRPPVAALLLGHLLEHLGRGRVRVAQALGVVAEDPPVLLLQADRERQDLALAEVGEAFAGAQGEANHGGLRSRRL